MRETLNQIQKLFRVRQCSDHFFQNRSRPCLQHQIDRCTAPCVGLIDGPAYREDVDHARLFLQGRNDAVLENLAQRMEAAASGSKSNSRKRASQPLPNSRPSTRRTWVGGMTSALARRTASASANSGPGSNVWPAVVRLSIV